MRRQADGTAPSNPFRSAKQSRIFAFSRYNSKMIRTFAHFLLHKGTRESQFRPVAADFRSILSVENRGGAANPWGEGVALPTVTLSSCYLSGKRKVTEGTFCASRSEGIKITQ
jgi:hypothetical protein